MSRLKVYVAASSGELDRVRACVGTIDALLDIEITERWWQGAEEWAGRDSEQSIESSVAAARACRDGVRAADVLLLLMPGSARGGCMVELGIAIERGMRVIVSDSVPNRSAFCSLGRHVRHDIDAVTMLRDISRRTQD